MGIKYYLCIRYFHKMERIYARSTLREYWEKYPETEQYLKTWYDTAMGSDWKSPNDVRQTYATASILKESRIVFNIKGNSYRLVTKINFEKQWILSGSLEHTRSMKKLMQIQYNILRYDSKADKN